MSTTLSRYTFLPWMRRGISAKIAEQDNFNDFTSPPAGGWAMERPQFQLRLNISASKGGTTGSDQVDQSINLVGPGDVQGIDSRAIVKSEPANWITNFEPNNFPYIEFYEEDFPWRYSPAKAATQQLRPWLMLVVLKESEFERDETLTGPLPSMKVLPHADDVGTTGATSGVWPDASETWAWAHVHFSGDLDEFDVLDPTVTSDMNTALERFREIIGSDPDRAVSRVICPRKLEANTRYNAFLVPTFETGRLAGLGADGTRLSTVRAQDPAFGTAHASDEYLDRWPIYHEWFFKTGATGDFEHLVRQIVPRPVDGRVGKRPMDVQRPGFNVKYGNTVPYDGTLGLEGALLAPGATRVAYPWANSGGYRDKLADLLNLSEDLQEATFPSGQYYGTNPFGYTTTQSIQTDPIVTPDIYGRWHALKGRVKINSNKWLHELNLDPRQRAVAGVGVQYIKKNQDTLMDKAWSQLGEVIEANRKLKWGQFAMQVSNASYTKHIESQPAEHAMAMTSPMLKRVNVGGITAYSKVNTSALPNAMETTSFRRVQRPNGPVMRRIDPQSEVFVNNNLRVDIGNKVMDPVEAKVVSAQSSYMPAANVEAFVATVDSYSSSPSPVFGLTAPGGAIAPNMQEEVGFKQALTEYVDYFQTGNWPDADAGPALDMVVLDGSVKPAIAPLTTIPRRAYAEVEFAGTFTLPAADRIVPVMAYPVFNKPMYEAVKELGTEYLIPNLDLIPNNTISLLETNQRFVESFMAGANHEMGRELLWREFPTDQRGSYFRQFWDSADIVNTSNLNEKDLATSILDIDEVHTWPSNTLLGTHNSRPGISAPDNLVLVVRGDLLKKFPNVVIYAVKAKWQSGDTNYELEREIDSTAAAIYPIFGASIDPDITFLGFDLTEEDARGDRTTGDPGYFFVLRERPGEIRFGVDVSMTGAMGSWNDLAQNNAPFVGQYLSAVNWTPTGGGFDNTINGTSVTWGGNSTNFAQILYQNPVMVCIHAHEMLPTP